MEVETCCTFTLGENSGHQTSKSPPIPKVLRCCPDPLAHGQLGLSRPEMTEEKSGAPTPTHPPTHPEEAWHFQASSGWGSTLNTGPSRLFRGIFEIIPLPLPTVVSLLSWRLASAARGASTGISAPAPAPWLDRVKAAPAGLRAPLDRWPVPLAALSDAPGHASGGHPWKLPLRLPTLRGPAREDTEVRPLPGIQGDFRSLGKLRMPGNGATDAQGTSRDKPVFAEAN